MPTPQVKLVHHTYSGLFGTCLANSARERDAAQLSGNTYSVFAYLRTNRDRFTNYLYSNRGKVRRVHQLPVQQLGHGE